MDMFNVSPPPSASGLNDLATLAQVFSMKGEYEKKLGELLRCHDMATKSFALAKTEIPKAKKALADAEKAQLAVESAKAELKLQVGTHAEAKRSFEDYKTDVMSELDYDRGEIDADREALASRADALVGQEKALRTAKESLQAEKVAVEAEKEALRKKLESVKAIGL